MKKKNTAAAIVTNNAAAPEAATNPPIVEAPKKAAAKDATVNIGIAKVTAKTLNDRNNAAKGNLQQLVKRMASEGKIKTAINTVDASGNLGQGIASNRALIADIRDYKKASKSDAIDTACVKAIAYLQFLAAAQAAGIIA